MLLTVKDMVTLLRNGVNVQIPVIDEEGNEVGTQTDPNYLSMTDDDLILFLKYGVARAFPTCADFSYLPAGAEFGIVLLAKIELYMKLAVTYAPKVDMGADNNNYLKQSQKFDHYLKLAEAAQKQYDDWLENEGADILGIGVVNTYDVLLSKRHYSQRNYEKQPSPQVVIYLDEVTETMVSFHWVVSQTSHFSRYKVYISPDQIIDPHEGNGTYNDKIAPGAQCLKSTGDFRDVLHRVRGLSPGTEYHIAVVSIERNQVFGLSEVSFTTLQEPTEEDPETPPEEDFSTEDFENKEEAGGDED